MPGTIWNYAPQKADGRYEAGFDRRSPLTPDETPQWTPTTQYAWPQATEPGGAMFRRPYDMNYVNGMGSFFTFPQGTRPQEFYQQSIDSGASPLPAQGSAVAASGAGPQIVPDTMEEDLLYKQGRSPRTEGAMAWERAPAPWDLPGSAQTVLQPANAPQAIKQVERRHVAEGEARAVQAAQAAKVAADNAVRAAAAGAPKVAATNASTAQAAANVAAGVAASPKAQQAAAVAQGEATRAVAAANVAKDNEVKKNGNGMNDWMELSGMSGMSGSFLEAHVVGPVKVWHLGLGALLGAGVVAAARYARS